MFSLVVAYSLIGLAHVFIYNLYHHLFPKKDSRLQGSVSPGTPQILITVIVTESGRALPQAPTVFEQHKGVKEE